MFVNVETILQAQNRNRTKILLDLDPDYCGMLQPIERPVFSWIDYCTKIKIKVQLSVFRVKYNVLGFSMQSTKGLCCQRVRTPVKYSSQQ